MVLFSSMTDRKDALRRHQLRTRKCISVQEKMSDKELRDLGCVSKQEREQEEEREKLRRQAKKVKRKRRRR